MFFITPCGKDKYKITFGLLFPPAVCIPSPFLLLLFGKLKTNPKENQRSPKETVGKRRRLIGTAGVNSGRKAGIVYMHGQ